MSMRLVQVGETTWINPKDIRAIAWNVEKDCPRVSLGDYLFAYATEFTCKPGSTEEACTAALLEKLAASMRKPTPPTFQGKYL